MSSGVEALTPVKNDPPPATKKAMTDPYEEYNKAAAGGAAPQPPSGAPVDYYAQYGGGGYGNGGPMPLKSLGPADYYSQYGYGYGGGYGYGYGPGGPPGAPYAAEAPSPLDAEIQVVIREIQTEIGLFATSGEYGEQFKNARRLLAAESDKLQNSVDPEWLEVDIPKPIKVTKKILIPNFRHPHFNFVGKILGPKGQTLQAMAKQFKCHIYVLGRGSTKDRNKEQELLNSGDPQYAHYGGPLHVKVETIAPAHVAYGRIAGVLEALSSTLIPVRDELVESQMAMISDAGAMAADGENGKEGDGEGRAMGGRGRGGPRGAFRGAPRGAGGPMRGGFRGAPRGGPRGGGPMGYRPY